MAAHDEIELVAGAGHRPFRPHLQVTPEYALLSDLVRCRERPADRRGKLGVRDPARRVDDVDGVVDALVRRDMWKDGLRGHDHCRLRHAPGGVDGTGGLAVAPGKVVRRAIALDRDVDLDCDGRYPVACGIEVDRVVERVRPVRYQAELLAQQCLRVGDQLVHLPLDDLDSVLLDEGQHAALARVAGRDLREEVALGDLRDANVAQDEAHHLVVELAGANEVDRRDVERLAVGRRGLAVKASRDTALRHPTSAPSSGRRPPARPRSTPA